MRNGIPQHSHQYQCSMLTVLVELYLHVYNNYTLSRVATTETLVATQPRFSQAKCPTNSFKALKEQTSGFKLGFYPRDVMLASTGNSYGSVSVICQHCVKMAELIRLVFGTENSLSLSCAVLRWNTGITKNMGTSSWIFSQTLDMVKNFTMTHPSSPCAINKQPHWPAESTWR